VFRHNLLAHLLGLLTLSTVAATAHADDWQPIAPEELRMNSEPMAPAAPAIYLYRQVDRDDSAFSETVYSRIKILTEEGRKYADVEISYDNRTESIRGIQARTIRPDGSIANFEGTIFEKPIVQGRGVKLLAKTFTLSDVQVGSIIEYRFRRILQYGYVYDSHWILSQDLFTKRAKFSLVQNPDFSLRYSWPMGLPAGTEPPKKEGSRIRLETHDVPAFVTEGNMPPERELKTRVDFIYTADLNVEKDPVVFWKKYAKQRYRDINDFVDERRAMEQAVAQIIGPADSQETKLRKIYARTQQIRNLSFERQKSEQEVKREGQKEAKDVADVWKQGYGDGLQITWLFLALARASGIEADPVLVSTRDVYFFSERLMNPGHLNSNVVVVNLNGKEIYLDPGTAFAPFGLLPWSETGVKGLRLSKEGGSWISTPLPAASQSRTERKTNLQLGTNGTLEGTLTVTYSGLEALWRRHEERNEDDADKRKFLESEIQADIPSGIEVALTNQPDWTSSESTLVAEYNLKVPGWASGAGQRLLLTVGLFGGRDKHTFEHASRIHPIYYNFPYTSRDDITIELPGGWSANSLPQPRNNDLKVIAYSASVEDRKQSLALKRELAVSMLILDSKYYSQLRDFFQAVRSDDEEQIVITSGKTPARR
jgi:hypothetical protein